MITMNDIIDVLSDNKLTHEEKFGWMHSNHITVQDLIDAVNYVTIERNFYKRKCGTEDYNTLPYSDPRVKALMKELKKQDECADIIREFVNANTDIYSIETIAAALGQVAKEYGYEEE